MRHTLQALFTLTALAVPMSRPAAEAAQPEPQRPVSAVDRMPSLPEPLNVRDWRAVARSYYDRVLDPHAGGSGFPAVSVDHERPGFRIKSYLAQKPEDEAFTCLAAVIGARLVDLEPHRLHDIDYVARCKAWFDPAVGLYRHRITERSPVVHADIYGYWAALQGMMLASLYPGDRDFQRHLQAAVAAFERIARGVGCPDRPDFNVLGFDFSTGRPSGRNEPMNRLGHAPCVAWALMVGNAIEPCSKRLAAARSALRWHIEHPGRYEVSHLMGPLAAARLNTLPGERLDLGRVLAAWFGDGDPHRHTWFITSGQRLGGLTCDGLDGARWPDAGFYAFSMGTLQGPAWLVPVARYDPRYAPAIARYALHAANSARLLQGVDLGPGRQDHPAWKTRWDPQNLLFYEAIASWDWAPGRRLQPYATGDPVRLGWSTGRPAVAPERYAKEKEEWFSDTCFNISLYMGNQVGFLGGILHLTNVPGILRWDCLATDWFRAPAWPTWLIHNPHPGVRRVELPIGPGQCDLYDLVTHRFLKRGVTGATAIDLASSRTVVLAVTPTAGKVTLEGSRLLVNGIVVDWQTDGQPSED